MPIRTELRHHYRTPQWFAARALVRERARDRCERCHRKNRAWYISDPLALAAIRKFEITKGDAEAMKVQGVRVVLIQCGCCHVNNVAGDDRPENLRWWCRGCHLRFDERFHKYTRATRKDQARPLLAEGAA